MDMDLVVVFGGLFAIIIGYQGIKAFARRAELRAVSSGDLAEIRRRLDSIERAVDAIAIEVERGTEAQLFTAKLLSERTPSSRDLPRASG
jgi:hypothetical protein